MADNGTLDSLNIKITVNTNAATDALNKLSEGISDAASALPHAFDSFKTFTEIVRDLANEARAASAEILSIVRSLETVNNIANRTAQDLGRVNAAVGNLNDGIQAQDLGQTTADATTELATGLQTAESKGRELAGTLRRIGSICEVVAFGSAKALGTMLLRIASIPFKAVSSGIQTIGSKLSNLFSSIKRIAFYRMIRASIKMITQALKEGIENLVAWDRTVANTSRAAETMDNLKSTAKLLTNTLGAMAMPIIQLVVPILNALADAAITAANAINQLFRSLQGYTTYIKAVRGETEKATGAAKALKRVLFGFDELNVLPSDTGGGSGTSFENQFEEVDIESGFFKKIKELIKSKQWEKVGKELAKKVNSLVSSIRADELGRKLGEKIQAGVDLMSGFMDEMNFVQIGEKIARFMNNSISSVNWAQVGNLLTRFITGLFDTAIGFLSTLDWGKVASSLGGFISGVINGLADWINEKDWYKFGQDMIDSIVDVINNLETSEVLKALWNLIKGILNAVWALALALVGKLLQKLVDNLPDWVFKAFGTNKATIKLQIDAAFAMAAGDKAWVNKINDMVANKSDIFEILSRAKANYDYLPAYKKFALPVTGFASGGFVPNVNTGSLFVAGESGAELVMHAPGGTEVMNGNQVEQAMTNANVEVINAIYAMANMVVGAVNNKNFDIYMDTQKVGKSVTQYQLNYARAMGV